MFKKDIYKYIDEKGRTVVSPYKPTVEYEHMYRLISHSEDYFLTNYVTFTHCIDIPEKDLELWVEVHMDDLNAPISTSEEISKKLESLYKVGKLVANQVTEDALALELQEFYDDWIVGVILTKDQYVKYDGLLFKVLMEHTTQPDWIPSETPSLYAPVLTDPSGETIFEWVRPESTNPYMTGDKVMYNGVVYICVVDNNVWQPDVYGWEIV